MRKALCLALLLAASLPAATAEFVVISNQSLAETEIQAGDLKQIFLGAKTSIHGRRVEPVVAQSGAAHEKFVSVCLGKTEAGLRNYFRNLVFSGKGSMPRSFSSAAEMVNYVAKTNGAIGYVGADMKVSGVTILTVK